MSVEGMITVSDDAIRLMQAAASNEGAVLLAQSFDGTSVVVGNDSLTDGTERSAAKWRGVIKDLVSKGILETVSKSVYRLTDAGYAAVDQAKSARHAEITELSLTLPESPESPYLQIKSNRSIKLEQLDFLNSVDVCISTQPLSGEGQDLQAKLLRDCVLALWNSPRPDRNGYDHSGPAKLRLHFRVREKPHSVVLPVMLQPRIVASTQWTLFTGSGTYTL